MALTFPRLNPIVFKEENILYTEKYNTPFIQKWDKGDYIVFQAHYGGSIARGEVAASIVDDNLITGIKLFLGEVVICQMVYIE